MIPDLLLLAILHLGTPALAQDDPPPEDPLSPYRLPFSTLVTRTIGSTSTATAYNWRRTTVQVGATGAFLFELNNFNSARAGGLVRFPSGGLIYELGLDYTWVWDTLSSELLALTPYRQPGRPARLDINFNVGFPLAEGMVTARPRFIPAVQLVLMSYVGLSYAIYPGSFTGLKAKDVGVALISPSLSEAEVDNLDDRRLDAMQVDTGRYSLMVGFSNDLYFKQGVFVSPRVLLALPVLAPITGTELLFWGDLSLVAGVAF